MFQEASGSPRGVSGCFREFRKRSSGSERVLGAFQCTKCQDRIPDGHKTKHFRQMVSETKFSVLIGCIDYQKFCSLPLIGIGGAIILLLSFTFGSSI